MITKTDTITPDLLSTEAAAQLLGYHPHYLRFLIRNGKIRAQRFGKSLAISKLELERYQQERMR